MTASITCEHSPCFSERREGVLADTSVQQQTQVEADMAADGRLVVARALRDEQDAFDEIFERYRGSMLQAAYRILRDRDLAEDAVQSALIQAWQHLPGLRERGALRSWLMRIVVNQCISMKRRLARSTLFLNQSVFEQVTALAAQSAEDVRGAMEGGWDLAQVVKHLPAKQQNVIALHYYQGMTLPEMAQRLQTSENTLKKRLQAALSNLRQALRDAEGDETLPLPGPRLPGGS